MLFYSKIKPARFYFIVAAVLYLRFGRMLLAFNFKPRLNTRTFISLTKDPLFWPPTESSSNIKGGLKVASFNLLAPCYKRVKGRFGQFGLIRESVDNEMWSNRLEETINFFRNELLEKSDVICLQEFWLDDDYRERFEVMAAEKGYDTQILHRNVLRKADALVMVINKNLFDVKASGKVDLCLVSDRVAQILWLHHRGCGKNILIGNTHLSFPHNEFDRKNQVDQICKLTRAMAEFAVNHRIPEASRLITGDLNVESSSDVCDHLRQCGYYSCLDISPPVNGLSPPEEGFPLYHRSYFVSHRTHRNEDLGVDHIFFRPQYPTSHSVSTTKTPCLFVKETTVLPTQISCSTWPEAFTISDHRPVISTMVFGEKSESLK